ncbi:hypothetical protein MLD38_005237 [Melastoma candidum]|uniref:Uncharacterized protein n=1 Tax=Melastoma candidum TaxID=119954 RepID=A0ACB9S8L4_9MYRT|nr:hypothetical protein MLD38_005237 [Melastoma candidum]
MKGKEGFGDFGGIQLRESPSILPVKKLRPRGTRFGACRVVGSLKDEADGNGIGLGSGSTGASWQQGRRASGSGRASKPEGRRGEAGALLLSPLTIGRWGGAEEDPDLPHPGESRPPGVRSEGKGGWFYCGWVFGGVVVATKETLKGALRRGCRGAVGGLEELGRRLGKCGPWLPWRSAARPEGRRGSLCLRSLVATGEERHGGGMEGPAGARWDCRVQYVLGGVGGIDGRRGHTWSGSTRGRQGAPGSSSGRGEAGVVLVRKQGGPLRLLRENAGERTSGEGGDRLLQCCRKRRGKLLFWEDRSPAAEEPGRREVRLRCCRLWGVMKWVRHSAGAVAGELQQRVALGLILVLLGC